jgi:hypothetical protein
MPRGNYLSAAEEKFKTKESIRVDCKLCGEVINAPCNRCKNPCWGNNGHWKSCVDFQNTKRKSTGLLHARENKHKYETVIACRCSHGTELSNSLKIKQFDGRRKFFYDGLEFEVFI